MRQSASGEATNTEVASGSEPNGYSYSDDRQNYLAEDLFWKRAFCQDLEKRGLLHLLSSGEPKQLGFTFEWYRHSY